MVNCNTQTLVLAKCLEISVYKNIKLFISGYLFEDYLLIEQFTEV